MADVVKELQAYLDGDNSVVMSKRLVSETIAAIAERDELLEELKDARNKIRELERTIIMGERG